MESPRGTLRAQTPGVVPPIPAVGAATEVAKSSAGGPWTWREPDGHNRAQCSPRTQDLEPGAASSRCGGASAIPRDASPWVDRRPSTSAGLTRTVSGRLGGVAASNRCGAPALDRQQRPSDSGLDSSRGTLWASDARWPDDAEARTLPTAMSRRGWLRDDSVYGRFVSFAVRGPRRGTPAGGGRSCRASPRRDDSPGHEAAPGGQSFTRGCAPQPTSLPVLSYGSSGRDLRP